MKKLNEVNTLTNVHLSDAQKMVMAKIKAAANANVAGEQTQGNTNLSTAQQVLIKLGLVLSDNNGTTITQKGDKVMSDENLTDNTASLTDDGQKYADAKDLVDLAKLNKDSTGNEPPAPEVGGEPTEQAPTDDIKVTESLTLFKDVNALANVKLL
jgi:hypothetical protein